MLRLTQEGSPGTSPSGGPALPLGRDPKIRPRHLALRVIIYVRQSSPTQVQRHQEGTRRQYQLAERAEQLGWARDQITIIDGDLGKSGAGSAAAHERTGFAQLVTAVGLGEVGLILALEVSRLARNSAEWYRLLDLAALAGCLLGDEDGLYDPRDFNDRLLLGLRGTISEVELHCIQARLHGAELSKARRGELRLRLPVGFAYGKEGQIELDPHQEVQGALRTIFAELERLGSAAGVLRFFRAHGLKVPRLRWAAGEPHEVVWVKPSYQAIYHILANPVYGGAYRYGQRGYDPDTPGSVARERPRRRHALDEIAVLIPDHHPGYLPWERYLANRQLLRDNSFRDPESRGAPRPGPGLLIGIVHCGRCGGRMRPYYSGTSAYYGCLSRNQQYDEPVCQTLTIKGVDAAVSAAFLAVIRPAEVETLLAFAAEWERDRALVQHQWELRLEGARYEAERARRQFDRVEPENRLVARELETRWNDKLRAVADLEAEYRHEQERGLSPLTEEEKVLLRRLVADVPGLWQAATPDEQKRLLRCLIREVVLLRDDAPRGASGVNTIRIGWRSGAWTELQVQRPGPGDHLHTAEEVLARIRVLAREHPDCRVAQILNAEGVRTRCGLPWNYARVKSIRRDNHIPTLCPAMPTSEEARGDGLLPLRAAARKLGVCETTLLDWVHAGIVTAERMGPSDPWWIRVTAEDLARLDGTRVAQGCGRWRMPEAQRRLSMTKEEIRRGLCAGQFIGYREWTGHRWEWRISPAANRSPGFPDASDHAATPGPVGALLESDRAKGVGAAHAARDRLLERREGRDGGRDGRSAEPSTAGGCSIVGCRKGDGR